MKVGIIIGSTREGRLGDRVGKWLVKHLAERPDWEVELLDIEAFNLPFFAEANHPAMMGGNYPNENIQKWSQAIAACDTFIFVTPEYNHSFPAALKNAIDWLYGEWSDKAAAIVSYSAVHSAGIRAGEALRLILPHLNMAGIGLSVTLPLAGQTIGEDGTYDNEAQLGALAGMADKLEQWGKALGTVRSK